MQIHNLKYSNGASVLLLNIHDIKKTQKNLSRWMGDSAIISENVMTFSYNDNKLYLDDGEPFDFKNHKFSRKINGVPVLTSRAIDATCKFEDNESNLIAILRLQ